LALDYCPVCALPLDRRLVETEERPRLICADGHILYENPKVVVGTIPVHEGKVWLIKRAIEPRAGYWTYPTGFMELFETVEEAALRETTEEIGAEVELVGPGRVYSRSEANTVFIVFHAKATAEARLMPEAVELRLVGPEEIPWEELAFWSTGAALQDWVASLSYHLEGG
jgi:ADP-ribose pyrophosphatase YjhB (NUDIX family)